MVPHRAVVTRAASSGCAHGGGGQADGQLASESAERSRELSQTPLARRNRGAAIATRRAGGVSRLASMPAKPTLTISLPGKSAGIACIVSIVTLCLAPAIVRASILRRRRICGTSDASPHPPPDPGLDRLESDADLVLNAIGAR